MGITKTDFVRGLQCPKMLWMDKHKSEYKIIPPEVQQLLNLGNDFGDSLMGIFGDYVEVTTYRPNGRLDYTAMIEKTKQCLENGTNVICEGAFSFYGNYCAADILKKSSGGYDMYEVKNSDGVKEQFLVDMAFQWYILTKCGVKLTSCNIIHYAENDKGYEIIEVTQEIRERLAMVNRKVWELSKVAKSAEEVEIAMGEQCDCPYRCWYKGYCETKESEKR